MVLLLKANNLYVLSLISNSPPRFTQAIHCVVYFKQSLSSPVTAIVDKHSMMSAESVEGFFSYFFNNLFATYPATYHNLKMFSSSAVKRGISSGLLSIAALR